MHIRFKSEGGFALVPGIQAAVDLDTSGLSVSEAAQLESLVREADFFNLPPQLGAHQRGAADQPTYTITIDTRTVVVVEGAASPALQRLIDRLRRAGRPGTGGGGSTQP